MLNDIDWDCKIVKNFSDINLGLKKRFNTGLNWLFNNVDKAIILEDDVIPKVDFFFYCRILLEKYEHHKDVWLISGHNLINGDVNNSKELNYFFSKTTPIWGWATWSSKWNIYDSEMRDFKYIGNRLKNFFKFWYNSRSFRVAVNIYRRMLKTYLGKIDTWDYQMQYTAFNKNVKTIIPSINLINNIGIFDGTNAIGKSKKNNENLHYHAMKTINIKYFDFKELIQIKNNDFDIKYFFKAFDKIRLDFRKLYRLLFK